MGEAKRRRARVWPRSENLTGVIDLRLLPPAPEIRRSRMRDILHDPTIPEDQDVVLEALEAQVGDRSFLVGFCLGDETGVSAIGALVMERLALEAPGAVIHVVPVAHSDIAWDTVLRHLRSFTGRILLFVFPDSDTYDAGTAEKFYSSHVRMHDHDGALAPRLSATQRRRIREEKARLLGREPPPAFEAEAGVAREDAPWVFRLRTPAGKTLRVGIWNGRRDYAHDLPDEIWRWVGGDRVAIVQVDSPVGVDRRSSLDLTHVLAKDFDGVIHWARDTETFQSIVRSFVRLDLESVAPPDLPADYRPEITFMLANTDASA